MIVPRYSREIPQRNRLEAGKCTGCGHLCFPPRLVCPECRGRAFEIVRLKPEGRVLSYTVQHVAADEFSTETPFVVAIIETVEGARLTARIGDVAPAEVKTGMEVDLVTRRLRKAGHAGILLYGYKAVPKR